MPPILETKRLRLRNPEKKDLAAIYRLGSNPKVMRYITMGRTLSLEEAKADLEKRMQTNKKKLGYWITEQKSDGAVIGWMALKPLDKREEIEIGYRFLEEFWGKGYATEAGNRLLKYAFHSLQLEKVVAVAKENNKASTRVMEKLGMEFEQFGIFYDTECVYYAIAREKFMSLINTQKAI